MKKSPHKQPDAHSEIIYPQPNFRDFDESFSDEHLTAQKEHSIGIFLAGFLAVVLLIILTYFFIFRLQRQNASLQTTSNSDQTVLGAGSLVNGSKLNLEEEHPNGTILRVEGVLFDSNSTRVQLTITNTREPRDGPIRLNQSWGSIHNTMILKDDFGEEYPLIASGSNPDVEVEPGVTMMGEFSFRGMMNPSTQTVTLVTNSKNGSPTNQILKTPLIEVVIPLNHTYP